MRNFILFFCLSFFLISCGTAKDAFTLKKKSSADEFLVEKKSPLVLPPEYGKLPVPGEDQITTDKSENNELNLFSNNETETSSSTNEETNINSSSIEKSILEKIE